MAPAFITRRWVARQRSTSSSRTARESASYRSRGVADRGFLPSEREQGRLQVSRLQGGGSRAGYQWLPFCGIVEKINAMLWPELIVLCGGITEEPERFMSKLHCEARLCVGALRSEAGIDSAALAITVIEPHRA